MEKDKVLEGAEASIIQVGAVVKNLDKTIEFLTSLGLGPFTVITLTNPAARIRGEKVSYQVRVGLSQQGPVQLELLEYIKGGPVAQAFWEKKGEGLHHILFKVRDLDATFEKFDKKGIRPYFWDKFAGGGGGAGLMETEAIGGIIIEVAQFPPDFDFRKIQWQEE